MMLVLNRAISSKYRLVAVRFDATDTVSINCTPISIAKDLCVPFITPGGAPGVLDEEVLQASGFISAIADNEYAMVDRVKFVLIVVVPAIVCIDDATGVGMYR